MEINSAELKALETSLKSACDAMNDNLKKAQDVATEALNESKKLGGTIEAKTADQLKEIDTKRETLQTEFVALRQQVLDLSQKVGTKPGSGSGPEQKSLYDTIVESPQWQAASKNPGAKSMDPVLIGNFHKILNATLNNDQPLVRTHRVDGIFAPPDQRLMIRDLIPASSIDTNMIEYTLETAFTNNAGPQGAGYSPTGVTEGEIKPQSDITFSLANAPVITIAHWIPASRQVLADAKLLRGHIDARLMYGLKIEEEDEVLNGAATGGTLNGIINQATAYNRGTSADQLLDTLLKGVLQVSLSYYEASGFVMHPVDWYTAMLLKDTTGRYLFSNPQDMVQPRLWAKPVVATQSMTQGTFLTGAFNIGAQIWDREDANIRISENVNDHFIRNMVAILAEERLALTVYRPLAFVKGSLPT